MKSKPRWMKSVITTAQMALPPMPFERSVKFSITAESRRKAAEA